MFEKFSELICDYVEVEADQINESSRFAEDLGFNSYDFMSMLGEAEEIFDVEFDEKEAASKKTVGEMIGYIEELK